MAGKMYVPPRRINLYFISGILLFSIIVPVCLADEYAEINKQKENIYLLINAGKYSEAKAEIDKMAVEYTGHEKLPEMLYWTALKFALNDRFDDAKQVYEKIIQNFPDNFWAKKARLNRAFSEVVSLIMSGKYAEAKEAKEKMTSDFAGNPDLPEALYWISGRFMQFDRFDDAKQIQKQIISDFPGSPWADKARMGSSMTEAISLIVSGNFAGAKETTDKMAADFANSPDLPEMLYWITERYERIGRADDAKRDYQRVIDLFANNAFAKKAKLGIPRAEVRGYVEAKDFNNADIALNKMITDFANHPDLPETLYWLAQRYKDFGRVEDANRLEQQIVQKYPDNIYASKVATLLRPDKGIGTTPGQAEVNDVNLNPDLEKKAVEIYRVARGYEEANDFDSATKAYEQVIKDYSATIKGRNGVLDIRRLEILKAFDSNDFNLANVLLDKFVEDFNQNQYAGDCLELVVDKYYSMAIELKKQNNQQQANSRFAFAENILQIMIDKRTTGNSTIGNADSLAGLYFYAAGCRQHQNNWDGAIKYFQKIVDNYPDYENICNAQAAIGWCYEALRNSNQAPKEVINPLSEEAYKMVLTQYPNCRVAYYAAYRMGELSAERGDKANAITYYRKFLEKAHPQDTRIEDVKAKLAVLEEESK